MWGTKEGTRPLGKVRAEGVAQAPQPFQLWPPTLRQGNGHSKEFFLGTQSSRSKNLGGRLWHTKTLSFPKDCDASFMSPRSPPHQSKILRVAWGPFHLPVDVITKQQHEGAGPTSVHKKCF